MTQFKTLAIPRPLLKGVASKDLLSMDTANKALAQIAQTIQNEAKGGWSLHLINDFSATIIVKRNFLFWLLFGVPVIGPILGLLFKPKYVGPYGMTYTTLVFSKET